MICISIDEFIKENKIDNFDTDVSSIREFAKICNTNIIAGHNTFVEKSTQEKETSEIIKQFYFCKVIVYKYLWEKHHPKYSYYYILGFTTENMMDIRKLFKAKKLKAFL